jgi:hypothetical protein
MDVTTSGRFRVLGRPRAEDELLLIDVTDAGETMAAAAEDPEGGHFEDAFDPVYVPGTGYGGDLAATVAGLEPGNLVDAALAWGEDGPHLTDATVVRRTVFEFYDDADPVFQAAVETWEDAVADGAAMNSRVTRGTDGDPNGVCYVFAKQAGARDLFSEFRDGVTPIEPLVRRVNRGREAGERAVFVLRPREADFVVLYIVLDRDGVLARTLRDTYGGDGVAGDDAGATTSGGTGGDWTWDLPGSDDDPDRTADGGGSDGGDDGDA